MVLGLPSILLLYLRLSLAPCLNCQLIKSKMSRECHAGRKQKNDVSSYWKAGGAELVSGAFRGDNGRQMHSIRGVTRAIINWLLDTNTGRRL